MVVEGGTKTPQKTEFQTRRVDDDVGLERRVDLLRRRVVHQQVRRPDPWRGIFTVQQFQFRVPGKTWCAK